MKGTNAAAFETVTEAHFAPAARCSVPPAKANR